MLRPCYLTQKQSDMFDRYCNSSATSLHDVYKTWSDKKEEAYKYCLRDMKEHDGQDMRITGANGFTFSCAYRIIRAATDSNSSIWRTGNDGQRT